MRKSRVQEVNLKMKIRNNVAVRRKSDQSTIRKYLILVHQREWTTVEKCKDQTNLYCSGLYPTEQSSSIILLKAGKAVVSSHLLLKSSRWEGHLWEVGWENLYLSLSLLLCVLCGNICFLCCSFPSCCGRVLCVALSFIVLSNHCPCQAVPTMHQ